MTNELDPIAAFAEERRETIAGYEQDEELKHLSADWRREAMAKRYVYNFDWLGRPIIQYPQDIQAVQEIVWRTRPDLIIECGIAHGGSLILSASMLALLDLCDATEAGEVLDPASPKRKVIGIDIDIRSHNRKAIEAHPLANRIEMVEGSSIEPSVVAEVLDRAAGFQRIMVCLDSMHTHDHVLGELNAYAPLVTKGCYCIVFDTLVEDLPRDFFRDRPWNPGNSPKTAVDEFLKDNSDFKIDHDMESKLLVTVAPGGFLERIR